MSARRAAPAGLGEVALQAITATVSSLTTVAPGRPWDPVAR